VILSRTTRAVHLAERAALLRTLRRWGPDAPTLCEEWPVRRLAAHIVVSEQAAGLPLAFAYPLWRVMSARTAGAVQARLSDTGERQMDKAEARGWDWLLGRLDGGPPRAFGLRLIAEVRLVEEWIHHEDVRRGNGEPPRSMDDSLAEALLAGGLAISRFEVFAASRHGIDVILPDGSSYSVGAGEPMARVRGDAGEVTLWLAGRGSAANVEVEGEVPAAALRV
jgi:uncharacterized protein (TIGR03085 family)